MSDDVPRHFGWCGKPGGAALPPVGGDVPVGENSCVTEISDPVLGGMTCPVCEEGQTLPDLIAPCGRCLRKSLSILYTNYKGETRWRTVIPLNKPLEFGDTPAHKNQWVMRVWDLEKNAVRSYALLDIHWIGPQGGLCPRSEVLSKYLLHRLPSTLWRKADEHLMACERCRQKVEALSVITGLTLTLPGRVYTERKEGSR